MHGHEGQYGRSQILRVDACKYKGAPSPKGATPALAKGTASIELAGGVEKATAAEPEALEPGAHGEEGRRRETPLKSEGSTPPQGSPNEGKCRVGREALSRSGHDQDWPHSLNLHLAAPKPIRRWHHQHQNSHAPWHIILLSSYPTIEEPSCLVLRPIHTLLEM